MTNRKYSDVILEYERTLLGQKKIFSSFYFNELSSDMAEKAALAVFKYAIETYLRWTPKQAKRYFTMEIIQLLKLDPLLKYIQFWPELNEKTDMFFIIYLIYPGQVFIDRKKYILDVYRDVLEHRKPRFPKGFFDGNDGKVKACLCFQYMLENFLTFSSKKNMYAFFSGQTADATLKQYRLLNVSNESFGSPVNFLHESLPKSEKDEYDLRFAKYYQNPDSKLNVKIKK